MQKLGLHRTPLTAAATRLFNEFGVLRRVNMINRSVGSRAGGNSVNSRNNFTANEQGQPQFLNSSTSYDNEFPPLSANKKKYVHRKRRIDLTTFSNNQKLEGVKNIYPLELEAPNLGTCSEQKLEVVQNIDPLQCEGSTSVSDHYDTDLPTSFGKKKPLSSSRNQKLHRTRGTKIRSEPSSITPIDEPFDICPHETIESTSPGSYVNQRNRGILVSKGQSAEENEQESGSLRPGMVLLKHYIPMSEQVDIVKRCRYLGCGPGGFYRPGYNDGAKLRLYMMCLGLDWNPQSQSYGARRHCDKAVPPDLPLEFISLVSRVIDDSHTLIERNMKVRNVVDVLPTMYPDVCIVNFYTTNGRLGLHQDRDESRESLDEGRPVVSISIGDSAEFLYGDQRDVNKADSVILESGDVLIFGGASRHIYHGKPGGIIALLDEACMFPKSTHETFCNKLYQTFKAHKRFIKPKLSCTDFLIGHYAGEVQYQAEQFLDKNKDYVVAEHQDLLGVSKCPFVAGLFPPVPEETTKSSKYSSIGSRFKVNGLVISFKVATATTDGDSKCYRASLH